MNEPSETLAAGKRRRLSLLAVQVGLAANILLAMVKCAVGILGGSPALLADGINSTSDVAYGVVVSIFVRLSAKPADHEHPYGHDQLESVAAVVVGAFVITTAIAIFWHTVATVHELLIPSHSISKVADGMPALGIVACVLGVVITMGKLNEPAEVLGHSIGAALVGTFMGVLLAYGFIGPVSTNIEYRAKETEAILLVAKASLTAFVGGNPPPVALEAGRRAIPIHQRPTFEELEDAIKASKGK